MSRILCSTGALIGMPNKRNHKLIEKFAEHLQCDGFEFMMYSTWYDKVDEIVADLKRMSLNIPVMHCDKRIGENFGSNEEEDWKTAEQRFEINCQMANDIGASRMVVHLWNGIISDHNIKNNIKAYKTLLKTAKAHNIDLLVENVVCNQQNPMQHWCELNESYNDVHFIFDTKMAAFHNQMNLIYQNKYDWLWREQHIKHLHINDYAGGYMEWDKLKTLPLGKGNINFKEFFEFINKKNYKGDYTIEATAFMQDGSVDYDMLNRCFKDVREYIG